jgi:anti-sigma B factor antagonist
MQVTVGEFEGIGKRVTLVGKLDIAGAQTIERPMATLSGSRCNVVVDMNAVDFIASIGIRHLVLAARAIARSSCKLVLLNPNPLVTGVLVTTGLQDLLPIVRSELEARAALAPAGSH